MKTKMKFMAHLFLALALVVASCSKEGDIGPIGPQGEQGIQGPEGPEGPPGEGAGVQENSAGGQTEGEQGDDGQDGADGQQGPKGNQGDQGPKGDTGAPGPAGPEGPKGDTGNQGPQGDTGAIGATGPAGADGNANATQYEFPSYDFSTDRLRSLFVPLSKADFHSTAWFAYLVSGDLVYPLPGTGSRTNTEYRVLFWYTGFMTSAMVCNITANGPGESYSSIRVIGIKMQTVTKIGKASKELPDLDFSDYHTVCDYYGLKH